MIIWITYLKLLHIYFNDLSYWRFLQLHKDSFSEIIHVELMHKQNKTFPSIVEFIPMRMDSMSASH